MIQDKEGKEFSMMREFADFTGKEVLEVGCGDGRVSIMIARLAKSLVAIDPDENRLKKARVTVPGVDFRNGSGEELNLPDGSIDIVAFTFSLHHQNCARALAEAKRVLRLGGKIVIIEPAIEGDMHPLFRVFRDEDSQILAALEAISNCGLSCERRETFGIDYLFNDADEVYDYFFGNYGMARDEIHLERMKRAISHKAMERPINLVEIVNMFSLVKI